MINVLCDLCKPPTSAHAGTIFGRYALPQLVCVLAVVLVASMVMTATEVVLQYSQYQQHSNTRSLFGTAHVINVYGH